MKILRILNNNVVLAQQAGEPVILTGLGIGFNKRVGDSITAADANEVFVPETNRDTDHLAEMVAAVPLEFLELVKEVAPEYKETATVVALADHLHMASVRTVKEKSHPLTAEVENLYPEEYARAKEIVAAANSWLADKNVEPLPDSEATSVALHLVNAGFTEGNLRDTYLLTGALDQIFDIIDAAFHATINRHSINAARFITHMRYFFTRVSKSQQINGEISALRDSLMEERADAIHCAEHMADVLELRLGDIITVDERTYLALHVARLVKES
ncbi:PRD domain-containing protein [Corynebacterium pyruviciproducens]|uniref:PRD domain-containing protein n=1 Tax=Corynebacterium pyruviciproducens TaxID=598660 RepID=A0AAF0YTU0_9CORY|nr:PRD domain-containing protein [Corynebacterium pyruviciproducens]WOT01513.1 PRD domain-containing protein [Corynebacterium pyruviciproducens]